jgi:CheY-like chemotaxis protein
MPNTKNVFIIDDNQVDLKVLENFIGETGYQIHTFSSPLDALEKMSTVSPHLIILDYLMPEMNGDKFMIKVSERLLHNKDCQVYLVTSKVFSEEEKLSMLTLGITKIFEKPVDKEKLLSAINIFLLNQ